MFEQSLRSLIDRAPFMYVLTRAEGGRPVVFDCNEQLLQTLGYDREELVGRWLGELYDPSSRAKLEEGGHLETPSGNSKPSERLLVTRDGRQIPVLLYAQPDRTPDGQTLGMLAVFVDISERKTLEDNVRELNLSLERRVQERTAQLEQANLELQHLVEERRRAEAELARQRDFGLLVLNTIGQGLTVVNREGRFEYVNPAYARMTGRTAEELIGAPVESVTHPEAQPELEQAWRSRQTGHSSSYESRLTRPDGTEVEVLINGVPRLENGEVVGTIAAITDLTERKRIEKALRQSNVLLNALSRSLIEYIGDSDPTAPFEYLLERLLELTESEYGFIGEVLYRPDGTPFMRTHALSNIAWNNETRALYERFAPNLEFHNMRTLFGAAILTQQPVIANDPQTDPRASGRPEGHPPLRRFLGIPFFHAGRLVGMVGIANSSCDYVQSTVDYLQPFLNVCANIVNSYRNHQRRREAEGALIQRTSELSAANAELARVSRLKDEFLANMSHELRTPLNAILGFSEALTEGIYGSLSEPQSGTLGLIAESGRHLLSLINDILDLSKIDAGRLHIQHAPVQVDEVCQASLRMVREAAHHKRLKVAFMADSAVRSLFSDERRLKQILVNLLSNAVKFTPEGGRVGLEVEADPGHGVVRFTVWDEGIGIEPEHLQGIFRPFVQVDSRLNREHPGTGLGLSLTQRLTELLGGSVSVESQPGRGSRFTIALPWQPAPPMGDAPTPGEATQAVQKALIVEDMVVSAEHLARYLRELGISTTILPSGTEVHRLAAQTRPDLILLDIMLPDVSGWEVLEALKSDPATAPIPVMVVSVIDDPTKAHSLGAAQSLTKPISREQLLAALRQLPQGVSGDLSSALVATVSPGEQTPLVLIAEDNEANVALFSKVIEHLGYRIVVARNGQEALEHAQAFHPDVVLMDVQMPVLDGLETTRRIRQSPDPALARVPIIALTALAMSGDRARCLEAGANEYLPKPVGPKELRQAIHSVLGKQGAKA
ncbi:MAG: response regulator [Meiothermus sp.]|nr:response regulator [Meiothermus sp.]